MSDKDQDRLDEERRARKLSERTKTISQIIRDHGFDVEPHNDRVEGGLEITDPDEREIFTRMVYVKVDRFLEDPKRFIKFYEAAIEALRDIEFRYSEGEERSSE